MENKAQEEKLAIVIDKDLSLGLCVNTAAVLALTLGHIVDGIIGSDLKDASGTIHVGITTMPIPILTTTAEGLREIRERAMAELSRGLRLVDFTDAAQRTRTYDDYTEQLASTAEPELRYLGIALHGPKNLVRRLTGSLPLLR